MRETFAWVGSKAGADLIDMLEGIPEAPAREDGPEEIPHEETDKCPPSVV